MRRRFTREEYSNGYCLYAFDLTADLTEDDYFNLVKQGSVRLSMQFAHSTRGFQCLKSDERTANRKTVTRH